MLPSSPEIQLFACVLLFATEIIHDQLCIKVKLKLFLNFKFIHIFWVHFSETRSSYLWQNFWKVLFSHLPHQDALAWFVFAFLVFVHCCCFTFPIDILFGKLGCDTLAIKMLFGKILDIEILCGNIDCDTFGIEILCDRLGCDMFGM